MRTPPKAAQRPVKITSHDDIRMDNYAWLRDPEWESGVRIKNTEILNHLTEENAYAESILAPMQPLADTFFQELKSRIKFNDMTVPVEKCGYLYFSKLNEGKNYWQLWRRPVGSDETQNQLLLDENLLAQNKAYIDVGGTTISEDQNLLAYTLDDTGNEAYHVFIKDLRTYQERQEPIEGVMGQVSWNKDGTGFFYLKIDENHRHNKLYYHRLGTQQSEDILIFHETNDQFSLSFEKSSDRSTLLLSSGNSDSKAYWYLPLNCPVTMPLEPILDRKSGQLYRADIADGKIYLRINDAGQNFRLIRTNVSDLSRHRKDLFLWEELVPHNEDRYLIGYDLAQDHLMYIHRILGLNHIYVRNLLNGQEWEIPFQDASYSASATFSTYESTALRINYSSLRQPSTTYDFDLSTQKLTTLKIDELPCGFNPEDYCVERLWATSPDGTEVPMSLVYNLKQVNPQAAPSPLLLYGYGSYGYSIPASFNKKIISLLDRGIIFAIAHIRGGDDLGYDWYEQAKFLTKKRTFEDFIACADHLIARTYTQAGQIAIMGGSAGGMLVGVTVNERPELFGAAVALVPFVDVLSTMLDDSLPLTPGEYTEWGNPKDPAYYAYIKSYSPYDNVKAQAYPPMLVTAGLSDPRVTYWEPAKWVAKLRDFNTSKDPIVLKTEMVSGHFGPSGITEELKEYAQVYAFVAHHLLRQ